MTAVQFLVSKIWKTEPLEHEQEVIKQAKEMEKDNIIAFGYRCIGEVDSELGDLIYKKVPEEVYNETYGSKGSNEHIEDNLEEIATSSQTEISEHHKTIIDEIDAILFQLEFGDRMRVFELFDKYINESYPSEQTEISDEEIEKAALEYFADYKGGASEWEISAFIMGMKKYREQLKSKQ